MNPGIAKVNRTVHWVSSALCLATLVFFSVTGITLNHPDWFSPSSSSEYTEVTLPSGWIEQFSGAGEVAQLSMLTLELDQRWGIGLPRNIDHDELEWVLDYQRPGGLGTVVLDLQSGLLSYEQTNDGFVALANDLHKGRHAGSYWAVLIDVVALVCLAFAVTGLVLLWIHASKRRSTWPLVGLGTVLPLVVYIWFVP